MSPSTPPPCASPPESSRAVGHVVVIDDDAVFANAMVRTLNKEQHVTFSTRAAAALAVIGEGQRFDVILCDLTMPEMSGLEFFESLQRSCPDQASKVIFLTGGAFTPRVHRFLDATANLTLEKPFTGVHLCALVSARIAAGRGENEATPAVTPTSGPPSTSPAAG
jgi:CheY-like chemotaxis protein